MGVEHLVLTRAARVGEAPAIASRWLQRILTFVGPERGGAHARARRRPISPGRGRWMSVRRPRLPRGPTQSRRSTCVRGISRSPRSRRCAAIPTLSMRGAFSTCARSTRWCAIRVRPSAERCFTRSCTAFPQAASTPPRPGRWRRCCRPGASALPSSRCRRMSHAVWWPRFARLGAGILGWENRPAEAMLSARFRKRAPARPQVGRTGVTLSGCADRIDTLPANLADIIDYKTGTSPSKVQAHRLIAPQLALEAALLRRGAFAELGRREPADLSYIRLKANGEVVPESILEIHGSIRSAIELGEDPGRDWNACSTTTPCPRPATGRVPCLSARATPMATTTTSRACSNGPPGRGRGRRRWRTMPDRAHEKDLPRSR